MWLLDYVTVNMAQRAAEAVEAANRMLEARGLGKRPDSTFTGRTERGFDLPLLSLRSGRAMRGQEDRREFPRP